jgi:DNA-binding NtrC family response regulator
MPVPAIVGADPSIRQLSHFIERVASGGTLVAIFGEPGSGRELVARAIHARSFPGQRPFVRVNCRTMRKEFLASELFGLSEDLPTKETLLCGAFAEAKGGTLFLDEVGELSLELQAKFLRTLEALQAHSPGGLEGRVVVATHRDLLSAMRAGLFREDLYDLLCLTPFVLPPLRRRARIDP